MRTFSLLIYSTWYRVIDHTLLFSLILFILVILLPLYPNYRSFIAHAQSLSFPMTFFSSSLYCSIPKLKNQGLLV